MLFHGWTESPEVIRERWERMRIPELDCTCSPVDDIACLACIEQARRRYGSEIPYNFTAGDVGSSDSGSLSDVASEASIAGSGVLVTGITIREG